MSELLQVIQVASYVAIAIASVMGWIESRKSTAKIIENSHKIDQAVPLAAAAVEAATKTHELVNGQSQQLLEVAKAVAYREGVEHADADSAEELSTALKAAETKTKKENGVH
jgi:hypothetical protein